MSHGQTAFLERRSMGRPRKKHRTKQVRLHEDLIDLADQLSGVFKMETPDFLSEILRPILDKKRIEAADILKTLNKPKPPG